MGKSRTNLSLAVLAAMSGMLSAADHIKVMVTWKNTSAEAIQQGLLPISRLAKMTVIRKSHFVFQRE